MFTLVLAIVVAVTPFNVDCTPTNKSVTKRGLPFYGDDIAKLTSYPIGAAPWTSNLIPRPYPSAAEVATAIAAAKQASANVLIAQQQVQAAKDHVLNQQRIAMEKETNAAILTQKSEAVAAIQRSEAASAAQGVVLAQQRLAAAKAAVSHQQKIASAREAAAAAALQSSAHAAAAEIQRTENEATKFANLQRTGAAAAAHHVAATKDAALAPLTIGSNHIPNFSLPWHSPIAAVIAAPAPWLASSTSAVGAATGPYYGAHKAAVWG